MAILKASLAAVAAMRAFVDAMAGIMFLMTPNVLLMSIAPC